MRLTAVLSDPEHTPLLVGRETATELGIDRTDALTRAMERTTQQKMAPKDTLAQAKKEVDAIIAKG